MTPESVILRTVLGKTGLSMDRIKAIVANGNLKERLPLVAALDSKGYKVIAVEDGPTAWEQIISLREPAIIILKEDLAGMSAAEICANLSEVDFKRHLHLLVLTTSEDPEKNISLLEAGADDCFHISTPTTEIIIRLKIAKKRLLEIKHLEDQIYDLAHILHGRYQMIKPIGRGGLGEVYEGWDTALKRQIAVKKFHARFGLESATDDDMWREAKITATLNHPNIVTVFDCWTTSAGAFVVMEYLHGLTLDDYLVGRQLSFGMFIELSRQILSGLNAAHLAGVYHCDLKPSNIMLTGEIWSEVPDLHLKILDFGVARFADEVRPEHIQASATVEGSLYYIAPEILEQEPIDARSDIYSLGHILYWGLTSKHAVEGQTPEEIIQGHFAGAFAPLATQRPDLPEEICRWVEKLMSRDLSQRPQSCKEALEELNAIYWQRLAEQRIDSI